MEHLKESNQLCSDFKSQIVHVVDRECDIYEFQQAAVDEKSKFVFRSSANRRTHEGRAIDSSTLGDKLAVSPDLGTIIINKDGKLHALHVRSMSTCLRPPQRSSDAKSLPLSALSVCFVEVREVGSNEDPIHWRLITNLPVKNYDDACEIIGIYRQRWNIECFHRI